MVTFAFRHFQSLDLGDDGVVSHCGSPQFPNGGAACRVSGHPPGDGVWSGDGRSCGTRVGDVAQRHDGLSSGLFDVEAFNISLCLTTAHLGQVAACETRDMHVCDYFAFHSFGSLPFMFLFHELPDLRAWLAVCGACQATASRCPRAR